MQRVCLFQHPRFGIEIGILNLGINLNSNAPSDNEESWFLVLFIFFSVFSVVYLLVSVLVFQVSERIYISDIKYQTEEGGRRDKGAVHTNIAT